MSSLHRVARGVVASVLALAVLSAAAPRAFAQAAATVTYGAPPAAYPTYGMRREVPYEDGMQVPMGAYVETRPRVGLIVAGSIVFGVVYLLTALVGVAASSTDASYSMLLVPVVGPLIAAAGADEDDAWGAAALVTGIQALGVTLFVLGFVVPRRVLVITAEDDSGPTIAITPMAVPDGAGLSLRIF